MNNTYFVRLFYNATKNPHFELKTGYYNEHGKPQYDPSIPDNSTGKVRMSWDASSGGLTLCVIDTAYTDWQTANPANSGNPNPVKAGTFNFPATFTPYTPLIESSGNAWC